MPVPTPSRTESLRDCGGGYWHWHRLLPDENSNWVMSNGAATHDADFEYSHFDPDGTASHIQILQCSIATLGPQDFNGGMVLVTIEQEGHSNVWVPLHYVIDGQVQLTKSWPAPGFRMTDEEQFCISIQHKQYTNGYSWIYGTNQYRAAEIDVYFKLGD